MLKVAASCCIGRMQAQTWLPKDVHRALLLPAAQGTERLMQLIDQAAGRISVMPAGGITEANIEQLIEATGAQEVHSSARRQVGCCQAACASSACSGLLSQLAGIGAPQQRSQIGWASDLLQRSCLPALGRLSALTDGRAEHLHARSHITETQASRLVQAKGRSSCLKYA